MISFRFSWDRQPTPPSLAELRDYRLLLLEQRRLQGLGALDPDEFAREFRLMTIQRGLKAIGTFSYQTAVWPCSLLRALYSTNFCDRPAGS